jgi:cell division protein FtsN
MIGMFVSFLVYIQKLAPGIGMSAPEKAMVQPVSIDDGQQPTQSAQSGQSSGFQFDDMLPDAEVKIPKAAGGIEESLQTEASQITEAGRYLLQVGSFRHEREADGLKDYLESLGIVCSIENTSIGETGRWYRVQVGPLTDLEKLNQIRAKLAANKISANIRKF